MVLLGESFGGLVALAAAWRLQELGCPVAGLVLVNPAANYAEVLADITMKLQ